MVAMSLITVFLFSGTVFGWGAFSTMLVQEGYYDYLCEGQDPGRACNAQIQALNNAFTIATTCVSLTAFINGWLVDTLGPTKVALIAGALNFAGLLGIAITKSTSWTRELVVHGGFDTFLCSTAIMAMGGSMTMFIGYQAPFIVPSHFTLLIEINSCLFDAGTIIFPVLKVLYDAGVPFAAFFWTYTALALVCFCLLAASWALNEKELNEIRAASGADGDTAVPEHQRPLNQRNMPAQLKSFEFLAIFIYSLVMVPRANMYMGTVSLINQRITERQGSGGSLGWVSTVTGFVIPFGFLAVPLIEMSIHRLGTLATIQLTTVLGMLYNALQFVVDIHVQLGTVCVFAAWRAFLYSVISAFNGEIFGVKTMGRIMGLCFFFSGITNTLTGPLVNAAVAANSFESLLLEQLLICIPMLIVFLALALRRRRSIQDATEPLTPSGLGSIHHDPVGAMSITRAISRTWEHLQDGTSLVDANS